MEIITADVLVVGGGAGGTAAAIQAARRGASVVLVSELPWLGGMLTSAGVAAPDGNELAAFQTGIWGDFLKALRTRHPQGLDNGWVSFFTYSPAVGAQVFADWVKGLKNLKWISGKTPREVLLRSGDGGDGDGGCVVGVQFDELIVQATITVDGTELGDVLALAGVPFRWGWETRDVWDEPSAPVSLTDPADPLYAMTQKYPVQSPTWVMLMEDYGEAQAPEIFPAPQPSPDSCFEGAWANCGAFQREGDDTPLGEICLNYGRLPDNQLMINWPHQGNDYGEGLHRLIESDEARAQYGREARWHSQSFARYIQQHLGRRYGLAYELFPQTKRSPGGAFALMPYYRESRRLVGMATVSERDILPVPGDRTAALPVSEVGDMSAIAFGNYPNDHHYPGFDMPLAPKAIRWGGRWTGTPFTIPYGALVPQAMDGLLVCEKNISVSHIANGATRLQPVVLGIGQAAGMAAALCVEQGCWPRDLMKNGGVRSLQMALITDAIAPAAVVPLFNLPPEHPEWQAVQQYYLTHPERYPMDGYHLFQPAGVSAGPASSALDASGSDAKASDALQNRPSTQQDVSGKKKSTSLASPVAGEEGISNPISITGKFCRKDEETYEIYQTTIKKLPKRILLVTVRSEITELFKVSNFRLDSTYLEDELAVGLRLL
ncbi:MAG: FAD-dependent oxidoreductase [Cyanobacteria bacterium J06598_3]